MRAGKLYNSITIERSTENIAPSGAVFLSWSPVATLRAEIVQQTATEFLTGPGEAENATIIFVVRWLAGISTADRIVYNGQTYDLKEIAEVGRRRSLQLRAVTS